MDNVGRSGELHPRQLGLLVGDGWMQGYLYICIYYMYARRLYIRIKHPWMLDSKELV